MKLLFDENLSGRLAESLADIFPGSEQVLVAGLGGRRDDEVWEYAKVHGFTLVSKDSDFYDLSVEAGAPPKFIWLRLGNCTTSVVEVLLRNNVQVLLRFAEGKQPCLVLRRQ